jgi:hypothetical protein
VKTSITLWDSYTKRSGSLEVPCDVGQLLRCGLSNRATSQILSSARFAISFADIPPDSRVNLHQSSTCQPNASLLSDDAINVSRLTHNPANATVHSDTFVPSIKKSPSFFFSTSALSSKPILTVPWYASSMGQCNGG